MIFFSQTVPDLAIQRPIKFIPVSLNTLPFFFEHFFTLWHSRYSKIILYFPFLALESNTSPRKKQDLNTSHAHCYHDIIASRFFQWTEHGNIRNVLTHAYRNICIFKSTIYHLSLYVFLSPIELSIIDLSSIIYLSVTMTSCWYLWFQSNSTMFISLPPCRIYNPFLQQWETWLSLTIIHLFICSVLEHI